MNEVVTSVRPSAAMCALVQAELETLYCVSKVLSKSTDLEQTLAEVLKLLHDQGRLLNGMVSLLDEDSKDLMVFAVHEGDRVAPLKTVRYQEGEGLVSIIMASSETMIVERLCDEPRFLGRLGVYDKALPFIGVPIKIDEKEPVGVFVAQPLSGGDLLAEQARFLEMLAIRVGPECQSVPHREKRTS